MGLYIKKIRGESTFYGVYYFNKNNQDPIAVYAVDGMYFGVHLMTGENREIINLDNEEIYFPMPIDESVHLANDNNFYRKLEEKRKNQEEAAKKLREAEKKQLQQEFNDDEE